MNNRYEDYYPTRVYNNEGSKSSTALTIIITALIASAVSIFVVLYTTGFIKKDSQDTNSDNTTTLTSSASFTAKETKGEDTLNYNNEELQVNKEIEKADALYRSADYEGAIRIIETALGDFPDSRPLLSKKEEYSNAIVINDINSYIDKATNMANSGDYFNSIKTIDEALLLYPDNSKLKSCKSQVEKLYVEEVLGEAEILLSAKDYDSADKAVDEALSALPDNNELKSEKTKIQTLRPMSSEELMKKLAESVVTDSGTYKAYTGIESINAYSEDIYYGFSINTAASYNLWGGGTQSVVFKVKDLPYNKLKFTICGESGTSGEVLVDVYLDRPADDSSPDYRFTLSDAPYPVEALVDISKAETMGIKVINNTGHTNRIVFYNFTGE